MAILPSPRLKHVDDQTGLTVFQYDKMAPGRTFHDVVVVKASFDLTSEGINPASSPAPLSLADTHRNEDDPTGSSLVRAGDLIMGKPGADIYVTGAARNPRPSKHWLVGVTLGPMDKPLLRYECVVTGPHRWQHSILKGWHSSPPELTQAVPIQYELAYGGRAPSPPEPPEQWERSGTNPSGSGYSMAAYSITDTPPAPQWEPATAFGSSRSKELVGLGPVARFWASRQQYAGTYDEAWLRQFKEEAIPDYPADFDSRFFQCAHPQLQTRAPLRGDEALCLVGLLAEKTRLETRLPGLAIVANAKNGTARLPLDTVHIDLDAQQVHLVWHLTLPQTLDIEQLNLSLEKL
jgi:hypothetical protein